MLAVLPGLSDSEALPRDRGWAQTDNAPDRREEPGAIEWTAPDTRCRVL